MNSRVSAKVYNNTLDFFKCLACMAVLFMHTNGGGMIASTITCLCRFAVPLFFMIAGYYSYNSNRAQISKRINRKLLRILKISVAATILYFIWEWSVANIIVGVPVKELLSYISSQITWSAIWKFLLLNKTVWGGTLWFAFSLMYCYIIFKFINRVKCERVMYFLSFVLIAVHIVSRGIIQHYGLVREDISVDYYRNWLFMGLPFFMIGHGIHFYKGKLMHSVSNSQLPALVIIGAVLSCFERLYAPLELFFGTTIMVIAIYIYAIKNPYKHGNNPFVVIGRKYSMFIYLMHPMVNNFINILYSKIGIEINTLIKIINPLLIFIATLAVAATFYKSSELFKKAGRQ